MLSLTDFASLFSGNLSFGKKEFIRNAMSLVTGSALSQVLTIAAVPVLSRLYLPEHFGFLGFFISVTAIVSAISNLCYERAIILPEDDEDGLNLLVLSLLILIGTCAVCSLIILFLPTSVSKLLTIRGASTTFLWFFPVSILGVGLFEVFSFWSYRKKEFALVARYQVGQSGVIAGTQLSLGLASNPSFLGLIGGRVLGPLVAAAMLIRQFWIKDRVLLGHIKWHRLRWVLVRYRRFPFYLTWSSILNVSARQIPTLIIFHFFDPKILGLYVVGVRLIGLPIKTVSKSVSKVFYQKLNTTLLQKKNCTELIYKVSLGLSILSVLPMLLILIWGPDLFSAILGSEWREAGVYSRILMPMYWARFITTSVQSHLTTFERQDLVMKWNMLYFLVTFLSLTVGSLYGNIRVALLLYSLSAMACYAMHLFLGLQTSRKLARAT